MRSFLSGVLAALVVTAVVVVAGMLCLRWYQKGGAERDFLRETERMELVARHDRAFIEMNRLKAVIEKARQEAEKNLPTLELKAPAQPAEAK